MRTILCLAVFLVTPQAVHGEPGPSPTGPPIAPPLPRLKVVESGPQLIPPLPDGRSEDALTAEGPAVPAPIRQAQLPQAAPSRAVPIGAAATSRSAVRRAEHLEPARLVNPGRGEAAEQKPTCGWSKLLGFDHCESSCNDDSACCCGLDWKQWCLARVAALLGHCDDTQQVASLVSNPCDCTSDCRCGSKCRCSSENRCQENCRCGGSATNPHGTHTGAMAQQASPEALPPCGSFCHVRTPGGNYFGRLRSMTSQWVILHDEIEDACHWIPRSSMSCLSTYTESPEEAVEESGEPLDAVTVLIPPPCEGGNCASQSAVRQARAGSQPLPSPQPLPLSGKVVYSGGSRHAYCDDDCQFGPGEHVTIEVPKGMRLFTLGFPWQCVMHLEPGDHLDLIAVLTVQTATGHPQVVSRTFAQNVQVADIQAAEGEGALALLLTPDQCNLAVVAAQSGEIIFSKRNPQDDDTTANPQAATLRRLLGSAIDELEDSDRTPITIMSVPHGMRPMAGMLAPAPLAMPAPGMWAPPAGMVPGHCGPAHLGGHPAAPEYRDPPSVPPFAAVPHPMLPPGMYRTPEAPFYGPAMPTFAPGAEAPPSPESSPYEPVAPPYLEPDRASAPAIRPPRSVHVPKRLLGRPSARDEAKQEPQQDEPAPTFEPSEPEQIRPLKTSQALPAGQVIRTLGFASPVPPPTQTAAAHDGTAQPSGTVKQDGSVQQAVAVTNRTNVLPAPPDVFRLQCSFDAQRGSERKPLGQPTVVTVHDATVTFGDHEFKFRVENSGPKHVQLTFSDPRGQLQVLRAREGEAVTLPWQSDKADQRGDVRVIVTRLPQQAGAVTTASFEEPAADASDYEVRVYPAAHLLTPQRPAAPLLARSLYARGLLDDVPRSTDEAHASLLNLVRAVEPASWHPLGEGQVRYSPESMSLVIWQAPENHARIAELFEQLRKQDATKANASVPQSSRRTAEQ